jgi:dTDP-4-dehydrorhamnose 3,5-epimerase
MQRRLCKLGFVYDFIQDNHSLSVEAGTIRGLHYQLMPKAQTKLVRVTAGAVYDVVVDIRQSSPTFGKREILGYNWSFGLL